jgi:hypothetical protein
VLACRRYQQQGASLNAARYGIGSVAIACATGRQLGEVVEGDVPDDFDDELGRELGGGVVQLRWEFDPHFPGMLDDAGSDVLA